MAATVQLVIEVDARTGTASVRQFGGEVERAFQRVRDNATAASDRFGRGLRESTQAVQAMSGEILSRLSPAVSGVVGAFSQAASAARSMPMVFGLATVAIAAGAAALGVFIERLQEAQQFQVQLTSAAGRGDLGTLRGLYVQNADALELYALQQRQANQEITGFWSLLQVLVAYWQKEAKPATGDMKKRMEELQKAIAPLAFKEAVGKAAAIDVQGAGVRGAAIEQQLAIELATRGRFAELDRLTGGLKREAREGTSAEFDRIQTEMEAGLLQAQSDQDRALIRALADKQRGLGSERLKGRLGQIDELRRRMNVDVTERLGRTITAGAAEFEGFEGGRVAGSQELAQAGALGQARREAEGFAAFEQELQRDIALWEGFEAGMVATTQEIAAATLKAKDPVVELELSLAGINDQARLFGPSFDRGAAALEATRGAMTALIAEGLDPSHPKLQELTRQFGELRRVEEIKGVFRDTFSSLSGGVTGFVRTVYSGTATVGQAMTQLGETIAFGFLDAVIRRGLKPAEDALLQFVENAARLGFGPAFGALGAMFSGTGSTGQLQGTTNTEFLSAVPQAQHGAIVRRTPGGVPIIVGEGRHDEAIVPLDGRGVGGVVVNIIDQRSNGTIEQRERTGPDGQRVLEVLILDVVGRGIDRGALDGKLSGNFGVVRRGVSR